MEVDLNNIQSKKLFIATPAYGGLVHGAYARSLIHLYLMGQANNVHMYLPYFLMNESLVTRARNYCVQSFLDTDATHMMFIDADIEFDPSDVMALLQLCDEDSDKDIVAGVYPKKNISWEKVAKAVNKGLADENPNNLKEYVGDYVMGVAREGEYKLSDLIPVNEAGTGFMMIKRSVFEKFAKEYPELRYFPDHKRAKGFDGEREITAFFLDVLDGKRHLSEDYMFCHWARKIGLNVWVAPWMRLNHYGTYAFNGNLPAIIAAGLHATIDPKDVKNK